MVAAAGKPSGRLARSFGVSLMKHKPLCAYATVDNNGERDFCGGQLFFFLVISVILHISPFRFPVQAHFGARCPPFGPIRQVLRAAVVPFPVWLKAVPFTFRKLGSEKKTKRGVRRGDLDLVTLVD